MGFELFVVYVATIVMGALLTGVARKLALSHGLLDVPNARSSHGTPTPRGGGASIVVVTCAAFAALTSLDILPKDLLLALVGGGVTVALVGFLDDRRPLPAALRLAAHVAAACWALFWLGGLPPVRFGAHIVQFGWVGHALALLGIVWTLNLFNFMDGIDGIAATEAVYVTAAGAALCYLSGTDKTVPAASLCVATSSLGFLVWNWPPARIFMGDVGSGYLGYVIAVLALAAARNNSVILYVWLILGGVFFVDATVTLILRFMRGERVYDAHRSHAYQWLSRRWGSHGRVTLAVLVIDMVWLLPCAVFASLRPSLAAITTLIALAPVVALATAAGSGRAEQPDRATS